MSRNTTSRKTKRERKTEYSSPAVRLVITQIWVMASLTVGLLTRRTHLKTAVTLKTFFDLIRRPPLLCLRPHAQRLIAFRSFERNKEVAGTL
jgi:hypothetical protein